jgi:hypothetical protein
MKDLKQYLEDLCPECGKDHEGECNHEAVSPAQRRARKQAYLKKTMAKYRAADKAGIPADQVNQRRNTPTRIKSRK